MITSRHIFSSLSVGFALVCAVSACGGGGGGGSAGGGGGSGGPPPTAPPVPISASGNLQVQGAALAGGSVVYSCGCSAQAGLVTTDAGGNFTLPFSAAATPSAPTPTYTLGPDRNYLIVGSRSSTPGTSAEAWTMQFVAQHSANNLALGSSSDTSTAAGSLYIFYTTKPNGSGDLAFDQWNFNTIAAWVAKLRSGAGTTAEMKLLTDINFFQVAEKSLYPIAPSWNKSQPNTNPTIRGDLNTIQSQGQAADPALPTPCPTTGCTGAPTP